MRIQVAIQNIKTDDVRKPVVSLTVISYEGVENDKMHDYLASVIGQAFQYTMSVESDSTTQGKDSSRVMTFTSA
jgi:hypothetical protein